MRNPRKAFLAAGAACAALMLATTASAQVRSFNVPSDDAVRAIPEFARQADVQIIAPAAQLRGVRTPALHGSLDARQALRTLLAGTGLEVAKDTGQVITLRRAGGPPAASAAPVRDAEAQGDADVEASQVAELVVTAQRREESLMDVPISLTALGAGAIEKRGLVSGDDFLRTVPALGYVNQGPGQNTIVIRGVYGDAFATGPTVGVYLGEIPLTGLALGGSADIKLVDVDRVEVLRGPQGTLYGANSLSGTIRYIPTPPKIGRFESRLEVGVSSTESFGGTNTELQGTVNIPIHETLAVRATAYRFENTGFIKNVADDNTFLQTSAAYFGAQNQVGNQDHVGGALAQGVRVAALWTPLDNLRITATYMRQDDSADDRPFAQRNLGRYQRATYRYGPIVGDGDAVETSLDVKNLQVEYDTPWGTLMSSTSEIRQDYRRLWQIGNFFPVGGLHAPIPQDSVTDAYLFSEEVRFTSELDGPLQFVGGLYYEKSKQPTLQQAFYTGEASRNPFAPGVGEIYRSVIDRRIEQLSAYGEVSYQILPQLKLTGGARRFEYDADYLSVFPFSANTRIIPLSSFQGKTKESGSIFKASAEFTPRKDMLFYAKYSEGFRLGRPKNIAQIQNFCDENGDGLIDGSQLSASDPLIASDTLESLEAGAKVTLFGGRAALSLSGYENRWNDIPVTFRPPTCSAVQATFNVGRVKARGFELEGTLRPAPPLVIDFGIGYIDSQVAETSPFGRKGAAMNYTPMQNGHIGVEYRFEAGSYPANVRADYAYYGPYYTGLGKTGTRFDGYGLLDLSAGITVDRVDVRVFVKNAADKYAITSESGWPPNGIYLVAPRTWGVRLGASF